MENNNFYTNIECIGFNSINLINLCKYNNIQILNLKKLKDNSIQFSLNLNNYNKFKKLDLNNYNIKYKGSDTQHKIKNFLISKIGVFCGLFITFLLMIFLNNRLLKIEIYGVDNSTKKEICNYLENLGIKKFKTTPKILNEYENKLTNKFDFNIVSMVKDSNKIIINIKEDTLKNDEKFLPICAENNMIIKNIFVYSGTSNLSSGDIVFKGDILIQPYIIKNNEKIFVKPKGKIESEVYLQEKFDYYNKEIIKKKTGKKIIFEKKYYIGKHNIYNVNKDIIFKDYKTESYEPILISNYFLPIKESKKIAYELKNVEKLNDFEKDKNKILLNLKNKLSNNLDKDFKKISENNIITKTNYGYLINYYIKGFIIFEYN